MQIYEIVYIATGFHYIVFFDSFIKSLEKFCPDKVYKKIKLLTDFEDFDIDQYKDLKNIEIDLYYIAHLPWPGVTLFKLHYMSNFLNDEYDRLFYFNSNAIMKETNEIPEELTNNDVDFFFFTPKNDVGWFKDWGTKDNMYDNSLPYVQGGMFGGNKKGMTNCCKFIMNHINTLFGGNSIEFRHDECAMNHYLVHLTDTQEINFEVLKITTIIPCLNWESQKIVYNNKEITCRHFNGNVSGNMNDFVDYPSCRPFFIKNNKQ